MVRVEDKALCCGCAACVQACPMKCIEMIVDDEGFCYPKANEEECINCGLCEKTCPIIAKKKQGVNR